MQILWSNYFLVGNAFLLARSQNCNFFKIIIGFFETNEPEAVIFTSRLIFFEDLCRNEKNAACCFLVCRPDCVGVIILWFIVFVEGELQSALNSTFYASGTCTHGKTEQLSTRPIISDKMLKMAFSVSLLKYTFDVKRKLLSFSKNGIFQHLLVSSKTKFRLTMEGRK